MSDRISATALLERGCRLLGLTAEQLKDSSTRPRRIVRMRWAIMWTISQQQPDLPLLGIGRPVGVGDHSSVVYALRRARALIEMRDPEFLTCVKLLHSKDWKPEPIWSERRPPSRTGCEILLALVPLDDGKLDHFGNQTAYQMVRGGGGDGDPALSVEEIWRRRDEVSEARARRESKHLATERTRYGLTRQTGARALSTQVA